MRQEAGIPETAADGATNRRRTLLLLGFGLLVALRLPLVWVHGRFLDEEGAVFFAYAWHRPAIDALLRPFGGYLNLGANAATLIDARLVRAGWLPLEAAPYLTMGIALVGQCVPAALLLWGRAEWLRPHWARPAALLAIAMAPAVEEVFLDTLHIQFHLALATALILALDVPARRGARVAQNAVLLLAPLCGPGAIVLLPLFAARALVDRDGGRARQAAALGIGAAIQLLFFLHGSSVRGEQPSPGALATVLLVRLGALPLTSSFGANAIGKAIHRDWASGGMAWMGVSLVAILLGIVLAAWALRKRDGAIWLLLGAGAVAFAEFGGGMIATDPREWWAVDAGERYNFIPLVLLLLTLIALAGRPRGRARTIARTMLGLAAISGAISYARPIPEMSDGPAWSEQAAAWRQDHRRLLSLWPAQWSMDLSDQDRPCTGAASDPTWCESTWTAAVTAPSVPRADAPSAMRPPR